MVRLDTVSTGAGGRSDSVYSQFTQIQRVDTFQDKDLAQEVVTDVEICEVDMNGIQVEQINQ